LGLLGKLGRLTSVGQRINGRLSRILKLGLGPWFFAKFFAGGPLLLQWTISNGLNATSSHTKARILSFRHHSGAFEIFQYALL